MMIPKEHISIRVYIDDEQQSQQSLQVRHRVIVQELIDTLCKHYNLSPKKYALYYGNIRLETGRTLGQSNIAATADLHLRKEKGGSPTEKAIKRSKKLYFEESTQLFFEVEGGVLFPVNWQPAIIGRMDNDHPEQNVLLAVDLTRHPDGRSVSRHHACLTRQNGQYYIEHIRQENATYLNNHPLKLWEREPLQPGDRVRVGKIVLIFNVHE